MSISSAWRAWPMALAALVLNVAGCSSGVPAVPGLVGVAPSTPEERVVAKHVLETTVNPKDVKFLKWGPHDLEGKLDPPWKIVRVRYEMTVSGNVHPMDMLFYMSDGKVGFPMPTVGGDDWLSTKQPISNMGNMVKKALQDLKDRNKTP